VSIPHTLTDRKLRKAQKEPVQSFVAGSLCWYNIGAIITHY